MLEVSKLLESLLKVSEKSANIARICRNNDHLFRLLVQEKSTDEKNHRFVQDFKTLADVLIQETIRHDIGKEFPELAENVNGEENNRFSNTLGDSVEVKICRTFDKTAKLLEKVLNNDSEAAVLLANEVHRDVELQEVPGNRRLMPRDLEIKVQDLGIWIDPIDSTAEYINGVDNVDEATRVHLSGLSCVTVLIGVFDKTNGRPVLGVMNQPFYEDSKSGWKGNSYWGLSLGGVRLCSLNVPERNGKLIVLSSSESLDIKSKLSSSGFSLIEAAGAGYKLLTVILGLVDVYILSKGSTFKWDTCAPQAILESLNGGVMDYTEFVKNESGIDFNVKYLTEESDTCNRGGLVAYRNKEVLESLREILSG